MVSGLWLLVVIPPSPGQVFSFYLGVHRAVVSSHGISISLPGACAPSVMTVHSQPVATNMRRDSGEATA